MAKQSQRGTDATVIPVLLTRPEVQSQRFGTALTDRFGGRVRPVLTPLMQTVFCAPALPKRDYSAVIFTSQAAVEAAIRLRPSAPQLPTDAFCVGARTAQAALKAGFRPHTAKADADALLSLLIAQDLPGPFLYLHGRETRGNLALRLSAAGTETDAVVVYQQDPLPISNEAAGLLRTAGPVLVPLFSPRSAVLFQRALPEGVKASLTIAAMSRAVADAARTLHPAQMHIAARPDAAAMLAVVDLLLMELGSS